MIRELGARTERPLLLTQTSINNNLSNLGSAVIPDVGE